MLLILLDGAALRLCSNKNVNNRSKGNVYTKNDWNLPVVFLVDENVKKTDTDDSKKAIDTICEVYIMCIYTN